MWVFCVVVVAVNMSVVTASKPAGAITQVTRSFEGTAFAAINNAPDPNCLHQVASAASLTLSRPNRPDWHATFHGCNQMLAGTLSGFGGALTMSTPRPTHIFGFGGIFFNSQLVNTTGA